MLKSVFDSADQCGAPNPLLTLSKNFGQTSAQIGGSDGGGRLALPSGSNDGGDLLVQEYLANVAHKTVPPTTFDMRQMLAQLPVTANGHQRAVAMEQGWAEASARSKMDGMASDWTRQFLQNDGGGREDELAQKWTDEFGGSLQQMEGAWQIARANSVWAKDFLERYETSGQRANENMAADWEREFLAMANRNVGQETAFFDYESSWEEIHSKEAQERYEFVEGNPYLGEHDPMERAKESLGQGHLADSILHFEAALQREPSNAEIWYSLGLALAENEQDPRAISALRNALKLSPRHERAILALAVSLANESFEHLALHELHKWICAHQGRELPADTSQNTTLYKQYAQLDRAQFGAVERQFLESARANQKVDTELQNALSILYNLGNDYDRAVDCLRAALTLCPDDPVLWNRLGATLANADRSPEAINAYKRALQLSPSYVRARYNLGTACMNLNSFSDAAAHFVASLQIQHSPDQSQIWSRLRSALIRIESAQLGQDIFDALERHDLATIVRFLQGQGIPQQE